MFDGQGTEFHIGDGAGPEVFSAIAHVLVVGEVGTSRESIDNTAHDSPDDYKEFIPGKIKDAGELPLELLWDDEDADQTGLRAQLDDDEVHNYFVQYPNGRRFNFSGFLTDYKNNAPVGDKAQATATFKISGKPTWSVAP